MTQSHLENELCLYLHVCGNTRESDLIDYGIKISGRTHEDLKKVLDEMIFLGRLERLLHDKLSSNVVYIAKGNWAVDLALSVEADALKIKDKDNVIAEARRILEEAEVIAEKRIKEKYPELTKRTKRKYSKKESCNGSESKMKKQSTNLRTLRKVTIIPQTIYCQPETDEDGFAPPQHGFQATKVYVLVDENGREQDGIVICPEHNQSISVNINHRSRPDGGGLVECLETQGSYFWHSDGDLVASEETPKEKKTYSPTQTTCEPASTCRENASPDDKPAQT